MTRTSSLSLVSLLALASVALAGRTRVCGSQPSLEKISANEEHFRALLEDDDARTAFANKVPNANSSAIQTTFHVIHAGETLEEGYVSESQIQAQLEVLNEDYRATGFTFELANISYVANAQWFNQAAPETKTQTQMKKALRVGGADALNVYLVGFASGDATGLLGYATFPTDYDSNSLDDGIVILYSSLPGGTAEPFNEGKTLSHEAGHWVGLYHTFQGGCDASGDQVSDTPAQGSPTSGCPSSADTCPDSAGTDAIHNYMDYSDDACLTEFTDGQIARMQQQLETYRGLTARKTTKTPQPPSVSELLASLLL